MSITSAGIRVLRATAAGCRPSRTRATSSAPQSLRHWLDPATAARAPENGAGDRGQRRPVVEAGVVDTRRRPATKILPGLSFEAVPGHTRRALGVRLTSQGASAAVQRRCRSTSRCRSFRPDWNSRFCEQAGASARDPARDPRLLRDASAVLLPGALRRAARRLRHPPRGRATTSRPPTTSSWPAEPDPSTVHTSPDRHASVHTDPFSPRCATPQAPPRCSPTAPAATTTPTTSSGSPACAPLAVVLPQTRAQAAAAVQAAAGARRRDRAARRRHVLHQGLPARQQPSVVIDTRRLEPRARGQCRRPLRHGRGRLHLGAGQRGAGRPTGMRTGYWGPLSGINATVGGALSQNSAFFGSALHGTVAEQRAGRHRRCSRTAQIVTTGSGGAGRRQAVHALWRARPDRPLPRRQRRLRPQARGDAAALAARRSITATCPSASTTCARWRPAQVEMARHAAVSEGFGIDRTKARAFGQRQPHLSDGVKILGNVARSARRCWQGIKDAVGVADRRHRLPAGRTTSRCTS